VQTLNSGQRGLRKLIGDPAGNRPALLDTLTAMEAAAVTALGEAPPPPEGMPEEELVLSRVGCKRVIVGLPAEVLTMQEAALREDAETLSVAYEAFGQAKRAGHEEYRDR